VSTTEANTRAVIAALIQEEALPKDFAGPALRFLAPLADQLAQRHQETDKTLVVGISGAQGTGKSTLAKCLARLLDARQGLRALCLSLDDFYLTKTRRQHLAQHSHPMLAVRGVPGTHDVALAVEILQRLCEAGATTLTAIPTFDKAVDDRLPAQRWPCFRGRPDVVLFEGWCVGARAVADTELVVPCNDLERERDAQGRWRHYVNSQLRDIYPALFAAIEVLLLLQAPDWDAVYRWRLLQEDKLRHRCAEEGRDSHGVMDAAQIARFIQYYERVTRQCLRDLPAVADYLLPLDEDHRILGMHARCTTK